MAEVNLATLKLLAKREGLSITLELLEYWAGEPDPAALCSLIDRAIDESAFEMARFPKELDPQGEDQLTVALILQLKRFGFDAAHDATSGGHCDIVIKDAGNFLWLGEAKKVGAVDNSTISAGFDQLSIRYATGMPAQDRGSLIVFCNAERIDLILKSWQAYLCARYDGVTITQEDAATISFVSERVSEKTGKPFIVRHKPISVYFPPLHGKTSAKR